MFVEPVDGAGRHDTITLTPKLGRYDDRGRDGVAYPTESGGNTRQFDADLCVLRIEVARSCYGKVNTVKQLVEVYGPNDRLSAPHIFAADIVKKPVGGRDRVALECNPQLVKRRAAGRELRQAGPFDVSETDNRIIAGGDTRKDGDSSGSRQLVA